jgi:hypothetical protein
MKTPTHKNGLFNFVPTNTTLFPLAKMVSGNKKPLETRINTGACSFVPTVPTVPSIFSDLVKNTQKAWLWLLVLPDRVEPLGVNPPCDRAHIDDFARAHNLTLVDAIPIYGEGLSQNSEAPTWQH